MFPAGRSLSSLFLKSHRCPDSQSSSSQRIHPPRVPSQEPASPLSCLLASCYGSIKATVEAVAAAGLRDSVKFISGGGPIDQHVVDYSGADTYGPAAQDTVNYCKEVYGK